MRMSGSPSAVRKKKTISRVRFCCTRSGGRGQGARGTGKTAVGLHRVAYLLYAHKEQVRRRGVVMIGPNRAFLSYIRNVLPALGEIDVTQTTVGELVAGSAGAAGAAGAAGSGGAAGPA